MRRHPTARTPWISMALGLIGFCIAPHPLWNPAAEPWDVSTATALFLGAACTAWVICLCWLLHLRQHPIAAPVPHPLTPVSPHKHVPVSEVPPRKLEPNTAMAA